MARLVGVDKRSDGTLTLRPAGELDLVTVPALNDALRAALAEKPDRIVIDLADVSFADVTGLRPVLSAQRTMARRGGRLEIRHASPQVSRVIHLCESLPGTLA